MELIETASRCSRNTSWRVVDNLSDYRDVLRHLHIASTSENIFSYHCGAKRSNYIFTGQFIIRIQYVVLAARFLSCLLGNLAIVIISR